jgi:predicted O-methyltransferase YrrM
MIETPSTKELLRIDLSQLNSKLVCSSEEFNGAPGKEHYKLLSWLASQIPAEKNIIDIGTHRGSSALALSSNTQATIHTFDIVDKIGDHAIKSTTNIKWHIHDVFDVRDPEIDKLLLESPMIFIDVDPHNGHMEWKLYNWFKKSGYKGLLIWDDIHYFPEMRTHFWSKVPIAERMDVTDLGHWSGTGLIKF